MARFDADEDRLSSLELGRIAELFDSADRFPITREAVVEEYGDCEIGYPEGSERLEDVLETSGDDAYDSPDELELAILNGVGGDAIGRERYSDRGDEKAGAVDRSDESL